MRSPQAHGMRAYTALLHPYPSSFPPPSPPPSVAVPSYPISMFVVLRLLLLVTFATLGLTLVLLPDRRR